MTELLSRDLEVMRIAQVARVPILIDAAKGQRLDVIDDRRNHGAVQSEAHLA